MKSHPGQRKKTFDLVSPFKPQGDQPQAIKQLVSGVESNKKRQVLLGVTGSGKTFTMANVISQTNLPALIISPNKTLAGQLYNEFKELFPNNSVEYFVSYYDYYQPEAYVPASDLFIEKDASINERIDRLRHSATTSILDRSDTIVIASVSCIYGLGNPETYRDLSLVLNKGQSIDREELLTHLVSIQYERNDFDFNRGTFRVRGDNIEIIMASSDAKSIRITMFDDEIEKISIRDPITGDLIENVETICVYPAKHYTTTKENIEQATSKIEKELYERTDYFERNNLLIEAQRIEQRTRYDLEMIKETGFCSGIENYSRHLESRCEGEPPNVLIDFFPKDYLLFVDESHITVPQIGGMYAGDRSRKQTLIDYGFRLPSALDNRPLNFEEFDKRTDKIIYVSATPGDYELEKVSSEIVTQIIRPTGLVDPTTEISPTKDQVNDLMGRIKEIVKKGEKVLVTTLTKKMAEKLTEFYTEKGIRVRYLHSDIHTLERMEIIRDLRQSKFDVLIGINLLREGLDIPEVSLIGILEADVDGFLRSKRSLLQIFGRAARNVKGHVVLYADKKTKSMKAALEEASRRREIQISYNEKHNITPKTISKSSNSNLLELYEDKAANIAGSKKNKGKKLNAPSLEKQILKVRKQMLAAAKKYQFEEAARCRDEMHELENLLQEIQNP